MKGAVSHVTAIMMGRRMPGGKRRALAGDEGEGSSVRQAHRTESTLTLTLTLTALRPFKGMLGSLEC